MFGLIPKQDIHRYSYPQLFSETTLNSMNRLDPRKGSTQNVHLMELRGSEIDFPGSYCTLSDEKQLRNINIDPSGLKEKHICFFVYCFSMKSNRRIYKISIDIQTYPHMFSDTALT